MDEQTDDEESRLQKQQAGQNAADVFDHAT